MEEIEKKISWKLLYSHPLFSCLISLYSIFLLYFPQDSLRILISPVRLFAGAFLISFLRFGSTRESNARPGTNESSVGPQLKTGIDSNPDLLDWNLKLGAPLEVIHEEEELTMTGVKDPTRFVGIERFPSLSMFNRESDLDSGPELNRDFPVMGEKDPTRFMRIERSIKPEFDLDSDSELDNDFPVIDVKDRNRFVRMEKFSPLSIEEEYDGEGLIEIKVDEYFNGCRNKMIKQNQSDLDLDFLVEEESVIEIDISS